MFLSRRAQRLLDLIEWFSKTCQHIFPNQGTLAGYLKCSIRTVKRALAELRGQLVEVRRRYRRSNVYKLLEDPQMSLFSTDEMPAEKTTPNLPVPKRGPTVVVSNSLKQERREMWTPLVIFRDVYRRFARKPSREAETDPEIRLIYGLPALKERS